MPTLEFGAWGSVKINDIKRLGSAAAAYDEHIRQARMMDELGYRYYWIIEHQASYIGAITAPTGVSDGGRGGHGAASTLAR